MPYQPAWFHRLDEILETLRGMESSHLDRLAVQKLFGVRERRARQLMAGLPGLRAGNAFAASRLALIARLEETAQGGLFQWETNRRARVDEELDRTRRQLVARRVRIPLLPRTPAKHDTPCNSNNPLELDRGSGTTLRSDCISIFTNRQRGSCFLVVSAAWRMRNEDDRACRRAPLDQPSPTAFCAPRSFPPELSKN